MRRIMKRYSRFTLIFIIALTTLFTILYVYKGQFESNIKLHISDSALVQSAMIQSVADFDAVYTKEDYGKSSREATLFQVDIAFQNIASVNHQYEYLLLDLNQTPAHLFSTEYLFVDPNTMAINYKHLESIVKKIELKEHGQILLRDNGQRILVDYRMVSGLDVGLITYTDVSSKENLMYLGQLIMIIVAFFFTWIVDRYYSLKKQVEVISSVAASDIIKEKYKFKYHTPWSYNILLNDFTVDSSITECLGYKEPKCINTLEEYYALIHEDDLKDFKFKMNDLMFNKLDFLSSFYRMLGQGGNNYIAYTESTVTKSDHDGYPIVITGMNVFLYDGHLKWVGDVDEG